jgi:hypothetical protein
MCHPIGPAQNVGHAKKILKWSNCEIHHKTMNHFFELALTRLTLFKGRRGADAHPFARLHCAFHFI